MLDIPVYMGVNAPKEHQRVIAKLKRDKINLEDEAAAISYHKRKIGTSEKLIGLVNLPSFYSDGVRGGRSSATDLEKLLDEAKKKKVDGITL